MQNCSSVDDRNADRRANPTNDAELRSFGKKHAIQHGFNCDEDEQKSKRGPSGRRIAGRPLQPMFGPKPLELRTGFHKRIPQLIQPGAGNVMSSTQPGQGVVALEAQLLEFHIDRIPD